MDKKELEKIKKEIKKLEKSKKRNYNKLLEIYKKLVLEYYYMKKTNQILQQTRKAQNRFCKSP